MRAAAASTSSSGETSRRLRRATASVAVRAMRDMGALGFAHIAALAEQGRNPRWQTRWRHAYAITGDSRVGGPMPQLLVRNLEDTVVARLKSMAAAHGRSLEAEVRDILGHAARDRRQEALEALRCHPG